MTSTFRGRMTLYVAFNLAFMLMAGVATLIGGHKDPRLAYLCLMALLCSSPLIYFDRSLGRYTILCAFMPFYFLFFAANDLIELFQPPLRLSKHVGNNQILSEVAILLGGLLALIGYRLAVAVWSRRSAPSSVREWSPNAILIVGIALWASGLIANWIWQVEVQKHAFGKIEGHGNGMLMGLMAARMCQPLGLVLVTYRFCMSRNALLLGLIVVMLAIELAIGFFADSKELGLRGFALVLVTRFLLDNRMPKTWLAVAVTVGLLATPIFQAYRTEVLSGSRDRGAAAANMEKNLDKAFGSKDLKQGKSSLYTSRSLLARVSMKPTIELILNRVGTTADYQQGYTIGLALTGLVPRFLWPDKPDTSTGQLFNRELHISQFRDTYISVSQLGELYWNFGWPGIIVGMTMIGGLLGFVGARCDLSQARSVTRLLVIAVTIYLVCARFEDNIAMTFIVWLRSLAMIFLLHLFFGRTRSLRALAGVGGARRTDTHSLTPHVPELGTDTHAGVRV